MLRSNRLPRFALFGIWAALLLVLSAADPTLGEQGRDNPSAAAGLTTGVSRPLPTPRIRLMATLPVRANVTGIAWSPDGARLAAYNDWGTRVTVWDRDGQVVQTWRRGLRFYSRRLPS